MVDPSEWCFRTAIHIPGLTIPNRFLQELRTIIRGLEGLLIVGADLVEVATPYDSQAELTVQAAADVLFEVLSLFVKRYAPIISGVFFVLSPIFSPFCLNGR